jgi:DNA polymerase-4
MAGVKTPIIAHIDLNSFFASVEQQANPLLRGKALGVCSYLHKRGSVIAASVEAKKRGMKVGMTVEKCLRVVPDAVFVENDPPKYRTVSSQVFGMLHDLSDTMERYSIDEAFFDLTGWYDSNESAAAAIEQMRLRMRREIGDWLNFSVGIAPTRFLAKTGSDFKKPGGMTIITPDNLDWILGQLKLEDVCGIGPRTRIRLEELGYHQLLQVKRAPVANLIHAFGKRGYFMWSDLNGLEVAGVEGEAEAPKSIGHSYCVPETANRDGKIEGLLGKLTDRASRRLRKEKLLAGAVSVAVGFKAPGFAAPSGPFWKPLKGEGGATWSRFEEPLDDSFTIIEKAVTLLQSVWSNQSVNFLAVTLSELSEPNGQSRLEFDTKTRLIEPPLKRRKRLSDAVDEVRDRHGETAMTFGRMMGVEENDAPERIGYRKL